MPNPLRTLAYISHAIEPVDSTTFLKMISKAQIFNASLNVTGLLILSDQTFVQTLEGETDAIDKVYARIAQNRLHDNIRVFLDEPIGTRVYQDWAMLSTLEYAMPMLIQILRHALERQPPVFTDGQRMAISKTMEFLPPA